MTPNLRTVLMLVASLLSMPGFGVTEPGSRILVINSDNTVEKYQQAESGFRQGLGAASHSVVTVSLNGNESMNIGQVIAREKPDLVYSIGSRALQLAIPESTHVPILFSSVINWERFGRGKNRYGIANELSLSQELAYLRYLLPEPKRIGFLYDPRYSQERISEARRLSLENNMEMVDQTVDQAGNLGQALDTLLPRIDLLWLMADPGVLVDRKAIEKIFAAAARYQKPVYTYSEAMVGLGASVVVAADNPTIGRQAANLAVSILNKTPVDEGIQVPAGSRIILNACQLDKLKTRYNEDALDEINQLVRCR